MRRQFGLWSAEEAGAQLHPSLPSFLLPLIAAAAAVNATDLLKIVDELFWRTSFLRHRHFSRDLNPLPSPSVSYRDSKMSSSAAAGWLDRFWTAKIS